MRRKEGRIETFQGTGGSRIPHRLTEPSPLKPSISGDVLVFADALESGDTPEWSTASP
jgi:hypothetical protein